MRAHRIILGTSALISIVILLSSHMAYPITINWNIGEEWNIGPYWIMPEEDLPTVEPGPTFPPDKPTIPPIVPPEWIPPEVFPPEAQWGSIALALILTGAMIYYIRRPKTPQELFKKHTASRVQYGPRKPPRKRGVQNKQPPKRKTQQKKQPKRRIHSKK